MNKCYQLIGVPGSGKSTWIKQQTWALGLSVVSSDFFIEQEAERQGKTYTEVFKDYIPISTKLAINQALICQANKLDFIWDQTNTTVASRKKKFELLLPSQYEHIAVVFKVPEPAELARRLASRPGKEIPADVMENMIKNFEPPTLSEGFTKIWVVGE